jgi:1-aminocyclopropane-1-carboxylate deaminase/D-cysteine desulfhydrase-like pyridoxal-dependent ACC family enzyme
VTARPTSVVCKGSSSSAAAIHMGASCWVDKMRVIGVGVVRRALVSVLCRKHRERGGVDTVI